MKADVVVLSVNRYSVVDKETGELNEGTTVRYILADNLLPYEAEDSKGYKVSKSSLDITKFTHFGEVPGIYSADLLFNVSSKDGKTNVTAYNFEFKRSLIQRPSGK